jgi:hypothetical protein
LELTSVRGAPPKALWRANHAFQGVVSEPLNRKKAKIRCRSDASRSEIFVDVASLPIRLLQSLVAYTWGSTNG